MVTIRKEARLPKYHSKTHRQRKYNTDIVYQNWHLECHEEGSRLYKLTQALALESDFNDLDVVSVSTDDGRLFSTW